MTLSLATLFALFSVGFVQSLGPCVLNRVFALSALTSTARRPWAVVVFFTLGVVGAYESFLLLTPLMAVAYAHVSIVYAVAAVVFLGGAVYAFAGSDSHCHREEDHSRGGVFLMGASTVLQLQPCCMPVAFGIVAASTYVGVPGAALMFLFYATGHAVPLLVAGFGSIRVRNWIDRIGAYRGLAYVNAGLLLFLSVYFWVQV